MRQLHGVQLVENQLIRDQQIGLASPELSQQ